MIIAKLSPLVNITFIICFFVSFGWDLTLNLENPAMENEHLSHIAEFFYLFVFAVFVFLLFYAVQFLNLF